VLLCSVAPLAVALPASAANDPIVKSVTGKQVSGGGTLVLDGACAGSDDPTGLNDENLVYSSQLHTSSGAVTLGVNVCWDNAAGGHGGISVVRGTFGLFQNDDAGRISGAVTRGGETYAGFDLYNTYVFELHIAHADGVYAGASGTLTFVGCSSENNGPDLAARLYQHAKSNPVLPARCDAQ
jgi:hypothetical protein